MEKFRNAIVRMFAPSIETLEREVKERAIEEFNIERIDGKDYVVHDGMVVSAPSDDAEAVLNQLDHMRAMYISRELKREKERNGYA